MLLSLLMASAFAAPTGDPVPLLDEGRFIIGARLGAESLWEKDTSCQEVPGDSSSCGGSWRHGGYSATGHLVIVDGVSIDGELGWMGDELRQAQFSGAGLSSAVGVRGGIPVGATGWWLSGVGRYESGVGKSNTTDGYEENAYRLGTLTGTLAWRDSNISTWGGVQRALLWKHTVEHRVNPAENDPRYQVVLASGFPVSGVLGIEIISEPLGPGWTPDWRISVGAEGSLGLSQGAHFWAAFRY